jgi:hypothetical protein
MNKHRMHFIIFFALITTLLLIVNSVDAAPKDGPVVSLSTGQSEYSASQDVLITAIISNQTKPNTLYASSSGSHRVMALKNRFLSSR